jgi:hypothetical protein
VTQLGAWAVVGCGRQLVAGSYVLDHALVRVIAVEVFRTNLVRCAPVCMLHTQEAHVYTRHPVGLRSLHVSLTLSCCDCCVSMCRSLPAAAALL